ncbi:hypothetical protein BKA62DRAFT_434981 [Auriculariales sp. MPI-PUGE-AT-0066]|nr:hypothetical protein BKA62DRAFT_434981 [Auriculariales sp. MPI-PUGE-AT-0066]
MSSPSTRPCLRNPLSRSTSSSSTCSNNSVSSLVMVPDPRRVHFPPTPSLTSVHPALPASAYDRSAIVVSINPCALPPRYSRCYAAVDPPMRRSQTPFRPPASHFDEDDEESTDCSDSSTKAAALPPVPTPIYAPKPRTMAPRARAPAPCSFSSSCLDGF